VSARRICPACHKNFVKGERALVAFRTGVGSATVRGKCAAAAVKVVPDQTGDLTKCIYCETNDAVCCLACAMQKKTRAS